MKKEILSIGDALSRTTQKEISGGGFNPSISIGDAMCEGTQQCLTDAHCPSSCTCVDTIVDGKVCR